MTNRSGWCAPAFGLQHTKLQHVACRSAVCCCEDFGGHVRNAQSPAVEPDSASQDPQIDAGFRYARATTKRAPDRQLGGQRSRALDSNILDERKC